MMEEFLSIGKHTSERSSALLEALRNKSVTKTRPYKIPYFLRRKTASLFRMKKNRKILRRRLSRQVKHGSDIQYQIHAFYARRYYMQSISNIFPGIMGSVPISHHKKRYRSIHSSLQNGVVFYDLSMFCQSLVDKEQFAGLKWYDQLIRFREKVIDNTHSKGGCYLEVLSHRNAHLMSLIQFSQSFARDMNQNILYDCPTDIRVILYIPQDIMPSFLRKVYRNTIGIQCSLVGFTERRWISLHTREPFDIRDRRATHFCVAESRGVPKDSKPFYIPVTKECESIQYCNVDNQHSNQAKLHMKKVGIVTYGEYERNLGCGAGFLYLKLKSYEPISSVFIDDRKYRCEYI